MEEELHVDTKYGSSRKGKMLEGLEQSSKEELELDWGVVKYVQLVILCNSKPIYFCVLYKSILIFNPLYNRSI